MKIYKFLLFIAFWLVVGNAYEVELGSNRRFAVRDPWDGDVFVRNCVYISSIENYVMCIFEKEKYRKKGLYLKIPITEVTGGSLTDGLISSATVVTCDKENKNCSRDYVFATTSRWEIIEAGDSYKVKENSKIEVSVYTATGSRDIYLHYNKVLVKN